MFADGEEVTVNARLKAGQKLTLIFTENEEFTYAPKNLGIKIVYEDEDVAVVFKPAGVASMPVAPYFDENLLNGLAFLRSGTVFRVVTRLDKYTSGLVLVAKNALAHSVLNENSDKTQKYYTALAYGKVPALLEINAPIKSSCGKKRIVAEGGKNAKTLVFESSPFSFSDEKISSYNCSLLKIRTFTGRTHQIRVHLAFSGHPLVGDELYLSPDLNTKIQTSVQTQSGEHIQSDGGQLLCCSGIVFVHPTTGKELSFEIDGREEILKRLLSTVK